LHRQLDELRRNADAAAAAAAEEAEQLRLESRQAAADHRVQVRPPQIHAAVVSSPLHWCDIQLSLQPVLAYPGCPLHALVTLTQDRSIPINREQFRALEVVYVAADLHLRCAKVEQLLEEAEVLRNEQTQ
jgi:hypothetical protein